MAQFTAPRPLLLKLRKPRNPLVAPAQQRQAGRHQGPDARQQARLELRRLLRERFPDDSP